MNTANEYKPLQINRLDFNWKDLKGSWWLYGKQQIFENNFCNDAKYFFAWILPHITILIGAYRMDERYVFYAHTLFLRFLHLIASHNVLCMCYYQRWVYCIQSMLVKLKFMLVYTDRFNLFVLYPIAPIYSLHRAELCVRKVRLQFFTAINNLQILL